uniref:Uncharacterized protein n=1 Tax=Branchiostoma floridae TaxID=7739 RepID=C3YXU3_BRAFL|eukprot:XP_002598890.1 hypothetical protein BRAFLDRAFT_90084 [Branchiostoma floridae]
MQTTLDCAHFIRTDTLKEASATRTSQPGCSRSFLRRSCVLDRYCRYTLVPYVVVVAALSGNLTKNWDPAKRNVIYVCVLLGVTALLLVTRVALVMWRHMTQSLYVKKGSFITMTSMSKITPEIERTPL